MAYRYQLKFRVVHKREHGTVSAESLCGKRVGQWSFDITKVTCETCIEYHGRVVAQKLALESAQSKGHITFANRFEFFDRDGQVYRAPVYAPVMTDGYRSGRWESSRSHFDRHRAVILGQ